MPKLTVRFYLDGNQVDEAEAEEPKEIDLRDFIAALKNCLSECVNDRCFDGGGDDLQALFDAAPKERPE